MSPTMDKARERAIEAAARAVHASMWGDSGPGYESSWLHMRKQLVAYQVLAIAAYEAAMKDEVISTNHGQDINLIEDAITEHFGERCEDFDAGCMGCRAWRMFDVMRGMLLSSNEDGIK